MTDPIQEASPGSPSSPTPSVPAPILLRLAAALCIFIGAEAIVEIIASLLKGKLHIDFGFLGIPVGSGLLAGSSASRKWALWLTGIWLTVVSVTLAWQAISGFPNLKADRNLAIAWTLGSLMAIGVIFVSLRASSVRAWFDMEPVARQTEIGWKWPVLILGLVFSALFALREFARDAALEKTARSVFGISTKFEFRDAKTGARLKSIGYSSRYPSFSSNDQSTLFNPRISWASWFDDEGIVVKLSGIAFGPADVAFDSDGYSPVSYTLSAQSPGTVVLDFQAK